MCSVHITIRGDHTTLPSLQGDVPRENDTASRVDERETAGGGSRTRGRHQPRASVCFKDVRELRAVILVRRVAGQVWAAAERDLADRSEALNSGFLVLHANRLPEMMVCWLITSGRPTKPGRREGDAICVP